MTERKQSSENFGGTLGKADVNPDYAEFQIAKAFITSEKHESFETRERAQQRISKWKTVLSNILTNSLDYGSRTPVKNTPEWATLEVITGGFATGELLASGPLQKHEILLLKNLKNVSKGEERHALNTFFLTDPGLAQLQDWLHSGCYEVKVPEEGALLVVAWLVNNGHAEEACGLIETLSPFFSKLRFYPIPLEHPQRFSARVHLQDVKNTVADIRKIKPNYTILAQKEAVEIWIPIHDRVVALFLETVVNDWPCQQYPDHWSGQALILIGEYAKLRKKHHLCGKMENEKKHYYQLRKFLGKCAHNPVLLTGKDIGRIRHILKCYQEKRGTPDGNVCKEARSLQKADVCVPTHHEISKIVVSRFKHHSMNEGLDDVSHLKEPVSEKEAANSMVPKSTSIPNSVQNKVERCLNETVEYLIERGIITSGETLAIVLPQMTSELRAAGIKDSTLRQLYASIYRAFRRRRSLLLLNLEKQIQIEELPWILVIEQFRTVNLSTKELAKQTLEEISMTTLISFPHVIFPNKLLQELRAIIKSAGLKTLLVDELAADIFMGEFSSKFVESAKIAAEIMGDSLYSTYFNIDYEKMNDFAETKNNNKQSRSWFNKKPKQNSNKFAQLCASRAGVPLGSWDPATNGMIIEQQHILTTQNLAALFVNLNLADNLKRHLAIMAKKCFIWICKRHQMKIDSWHARLIMIKNTAYAWRQMIFFLALLPSNDIVDFLSWATEHMNKQSEDFQNRFLPALNGLKLAAENKTIDHNSPDVRRFLGWSNTRHWLMTDINC